MRVWLPSNLQRKVDLSGLGKSAVYNPARRLDYLARTDFWKPIPEAVPNITLSGYRGPTCHIYLCVKSYVIPTQLSADKNDII